MYPDPNIDIYLCIFFCYIQAVNQGQDCQYGDLEVFLEDISRKASLDILGNSLRLNFIWSLLTLSEKMLRML